MKKLFSILALFFCVFSISAANFVTHTVTITNAPTTNGQTITINSNVRTWTNSVISASTQILTNAFIGGIATNLYNQLGTYGISGMLVERSGTNAVKLRGYDLTVTASAGWCSITSTTNTSTNNYVVSVPFSNMGSTNRNIIGDQLVSDLNVYAQTNKFNQNSNIVSELVGLTNTQTISGNKTYTGNILIINGTNVFRGTVTNANLTNIVGLSGNLGSGRITNGVFIDPFLTNSTITNAALISGTVGNMAGGFFLNPSTTNLVNRGNAISSPRTNVNNSEQFGSDAAATGEGSTALGSGSISSGVSSAAFGAESSASGESSVALGSGSTVYGLGGISIGSSSISSNDYAVAIGGNSRATNLNSVAIGYLSATTTSNQIVLGSSTVDYVYTPGRIEAALGFTNLNAKGSNTITGGLSFDRLDNSSLANGNNAGVDPGTNATEKVYIKVSGPTAAFTINGIKHWRNGRMLRIQNSTGYAMTIANDSGVDPVAGNRIYTGIGADVTFTNNPTILDFTYDSASSHWILQTVVATASAGLTFLNLNPSQFSGGTYSNIAVAAPFTNPIIYTNITFTNASGFKATNNAGVNTTNEFVFNFGGQKAWTVKASSNLFEIHTSTGFPVQIDQSGTVTADSFSGNGIVVADAIIDNASIAGLTVGAAGLTTEYINGVVGITTQELTVDGYAITRNGADYVLRTTDQTIDSTTVADDNTLQFSLDASERADFYIHAKFVAGTVAADGIKCQLASSAGSGYGLWRTTITTGGTGAFALATWEDQFGMPHSASTSDSDTELTISGFIVKDATPGIVKLQWAKNADAGTGLTIKSNSIVRFTKVP